MCCSCFYQRQYICFYEGVKNEMEVGLTYLWQEEYGERYYRVQTDDKDVAKKLYRRNGFRLCGYGMNVSLWIFCCEFSRRDIARKAIESVTGENGKIDAEGMFVFGNN